MIYVPVGRDVLPEFLSSGFIGVPVTDDPEADLQLEVPSCCVALRNPASDEDLVHLSISHEISLEIVDETPIGLIVRGPISMGFVDAVCFSSREALLDFEATYEVMPDIELSLYELVVLDPNLPSESIEFKLNRSPEPTGGGGCSTK